MLCYVISSPAFQIRFAFSLPLQPEKMVLVQKFDILHFFGFFATWAASRATAYRLTIAHNQYRVAKYPSAWAKAEKGVRIALLWVRFGRLGRLL